MGILWEHVPQNPFSSATYNMHQWGCCVERGEVNCEDSNVSMCVPHTRGGEGGGVMY